MSWSDDGPSETNHTVEKAMRDAAYRGNRQKLIDYMHVKIAEGDWHGVSDVANDLRVMEARHER